MRNGFLVQTRNPEDIAEKVLILLKDETLRKKISENNLADVQKYNWNSIIIQLEQIYKKST
jgi:glycosyltransferase involved in cell wall biosynthesis